jgi:hypothetical protein
MHSAMIVVLCLLASFSRGQSGNEWIQYDQQYWKVPVWQDGIHRIGYESLVSAGFPASLVNTNQIQVYAREKQLRVVMADGSDNALDPGDYIEFFGRKNDGWLDSLTYDDPDHVSNPFYSLFNDTSYVFITVGSTNGLRVETLNVTDTSMPEEDYCWFTALAEYHNEYHQGRLDPNGIGLPSYGTAEGWMSWRFSKGTSFHSDLSTPNVHSVPGAPPARVIAASAGASLAQGFPNHHLQLGWGTPFNEMIDTVYYGYQYNLLEFTIPAQQVSSVTRITHRSIDDLGVAVDNHAVAWVQMSYPHSWEFNDYSAGSAFRVFDTNNDGWIHFRVNNLPFGAPRFLIGEGWSMREVSAVPDGTGWRCSFDAISPGAGVVIRIVPQGAWTNATGVSRATQSGFFTDYIAEELDSAFVIITHESLFNAAQAYKVYREQQGMDVLLADVDELYLQYGGGIPKHPLAISRFCSDLLNAWASPPSHLFIIGKSIHEMTISANTGSRVSPELYARNLVPSWGWPGSDAMFTSRFSAPLYQPKIPAGRLAAENPQQVQEYLAKVIQLESQPPQRWQKNILHFGGGGNAFEQNLFKGYLQGYENIAEDTSYAAQVYTFLKNTTDPIQMNLSDSIQLLINEGAAVMTFFGHASSTGFDQNIDEPQNYSNQGKYPLLIGNSCYTGNIHLAESQSTSERFVLVPERGVIGFMAKSDLGIPLYLDMYTRAFYRNLFQDNYGKSIGQCMRASITDFQQAGDFYRENVALTFALHGDPAVRLYPHPLPDYDVTAPDVLFTPAQVTAQSETLTVSVNVHNIGKAINEPVGIELIRRYPDGSDTSLVQTLPHIYHSEVVSFEMPIDPLRGAGQNFFDVFVDYPASAIDEMEDASNNVLANLPLFISSGDLVPVYPYPFAVVPLASQTLKASTGYPLEPERPYRIQIDTTDSFDSPWMQSTVITQPGGVVEWTLPFALSDSTVYFWRCSADSTSTDQTFRWRESSFQYISGVSGWGQDHFYQLEDNPRSGLGYDRQSRSLSFDPLAADLRCEVYGNPTTTFEALGTRYMIDLDVQDYSGPGFYPCIMVAVMDSISLAPWESNYNGTNPENEFGNSMVSSNARNRPERYFIFGQENASELSGLVNLLNNEIENGQYVLAYSWMYATYDNWTALAPELFDAFASLGAEVIGQSQDSVPFIFFAQKGDPTSVMEVIGSDINSEISLDATMNGRSDFGIMHTPEIGPALNWQTARWRFTGDSDTDSLQLEITGIPYSGPDVMLNDYSLFTQEENNLSALADESVFPTIKMSASLGDAGAASPLQLQRWHVEYEPVPECALDPESGYYFTGAPFREGQDVSFSMAVRNISPVPMDSLLIHYWVEDAQRIPHTLATVRRQPLAPEEILRDTITFSTTGFSGSNVLFMEVNPFSPALNAYDQPEQFHFNNIAQIPFTVNADEVNPLLDVTFDGLHILNRDIVSANPEIAVLLDDDNPFLLLNEPQDTAFYRIFIAEPGEDARPVYFSDPQMTWIPADSESNRSGIIYNPAFTKDGIHELLVQARDKSGNSSGASDYRVEFEVVLRPTISEVINYPNPFSTSTRFVFTLTGTEPPDEVKIQIMTIGGKIVREITQDELGLLRIGRNVTDFQWNGTDEFGDPLANGVYLYRVLARLNGQDLELRQDSNRSFTEKGFGKMYLMR